MKSMCCRCVGHYDPSEDADANATFCGPCARKLETLSRDAKTYQDKINAGDPTVILRPLRTLVKFAARYIAD